MQNSNKVKMDRLIWHRSGNTLINRVSREGIQREIISTVEARSREDLRGGQVTDNVPLRKEPFKRKIDHAIPGTALRSQYTDLSGKLEIHADQGFRSIRATANIRTGEKIVVVKPFASVADRTTLPYCLTCKIENSKFEKCKDCNLVLYCKSPSCPQNQAHKYECGTDFHCIQFGDDLDVKLAIQMVFESLVIYENVCDLIRAVNQYRGNDRPIEILSDRQRFECIMKLCGHPPENFYRKVFEAFRIITAYPEVRGKFDDDGRRNFLKHLLAHFLKVITANSFNFEQGKREKIKLYAIYDSISFFNHSCSPNALSFMILTKMIIVSSRCINAGNEVRICYLPKFHDISWTREERRNKLLKSWQFNCDCERCSKSEIRERHMNSVRQTMKQQRPRLRTTIKKIKFIETTLDELTLNSNDWTQEIGAYCIEYFKACKEQLKPAETE